VTISIFYQNKNRERIPTRACVAAMPDHEFSRLFCFTFFVLFVSFVVQSLSGTGK